MKFTASNVKTIRLPDGKADHFEPDDAMPNFYVRVRGNKAGDIKRNFYVQRRFNGAQYREDLGSVYQVSLTDAREAARIIFGKMAQGINPGAERAKARQQAAIVQPTLADIGERYIAAKLDSLSITSIKAAERNFSIHWAALAKRFISDIKRVEIGGYAANDAQKLRRRSRSAGKVSVIVGIRLGNARGFGRGQSGYRHQQSSRGAAKP